MGSVQKSWPKASAHGTNRPMRPILYSNRMDSGTPGGTRTPDARLRTPPLYPTELQGHTKCIGGDSGARTRNLGIANAALSQLSYIPTLTVTRHPGATTVNPS